MNKTVLRNIHLVNWYGFSNRTIPVSENLTLISGENECGKSTILDAIKYAYTGDTQFNKASNGYNTGVGKRNLVSYTRCLIDASAGKYARGADQMSDVYTHIALEYYDQVNENPFVLGVVIETAITDIRGTYWYAMDAKTIKDISFVYEDHGIIKPYDASGFSKKHNIKMRGKKEGVSLFMQMIGLKLPYQEVSKYQRKLRNIMAYNPAAKIQEFIKESVLEEHNINFDKLRNAKKNIESINNSLEQINQELNDLDSILNDYEEYDKKALQLKVDDIKIQYKELLRCQKDIYEANEYIQKNSKTCEMLNTTILQQDQEITDIENAYLETRSALKDLDVSKAIEISKQLINTYELQLSKLNDEKQKLELFQRQMQHLTDEFVAFDFTIVDQNMIEKLSSIYMEVSEKQSYIDQLKKQISECRDQLIKNKTLLEEKLKEINQECVMQQHIIEECNRNRIDYSSVQEQMELMKEINREFKKRGIQDEAHMACEYVVELKDEKWRNAIEAFLGIHRYAIIVPKELFDIANHILDQSKHRYVELVNTRRLMARDMKCEEDSVFHFLTIQNETAAKYFMFWLGRIHAVDMKDVANFDLAMSKEGKLSRNMAVTYINTKRIKSYCLGSQAIEINKRLAEKKLKELEINEKELYKHANDLQKHADQLKLGLDYFKEFNLNAHKEWMQVSSNLKAEKKNYQELLEAQKNNAEFMALNLRVSELEHQLVIKKKAREENVKNKTILETAISQKEKSIIQYKAEEKIKQEIIDDERVLYNVAVEKAIKEYDGYIANENKRGNVLAFETKKNIERRVRELEGNINGKQQSYNNRKQEVDRLPIGLAHEADYQKRRGKIWIDDLQGIQKKLKQQTIKYEKIFKNEFVMNIYETAKDARKDIFDINKELRKLQFSTKYQFDVKMLNDNSDYAKVLRYAEYLQQSNDIEQDQLSFTSLMGYDQDEVETREKEIREIINNIIDHNDTAIIKKFADYRNYMSYEIIINNDEVTNGKLSKQVGYNSGAGTQIPYTLILSAALSMLYNARVNCVRLIFIDEPFEKMSDHNIKLMLEFFKNQNFQVIFCAPPNKLESIGSECGVIIPVLKYSNDNMQIGEIRFHER